MIISIFTPHGGCPERCSFCDQSVSGGTPVSPSQIQKTIEEHLESQTHSKRKTERPIEIAFYGGTFTALSPFQQTRMLDAVAPYLKSGQIQSLRISTRPDAVDREWIKHLKENYALKTVELGVQSFDPQVLQALGRTHGLPCVEKSAVVLRDLEIQFGFHFMFGCPGEKESGDAELIENLKKLKPDFVRLHPLLVIQGTVLEKTWREGLWVPLELEPAIERGAALTEAIEKDCKILVIRIGLQPNELLEEAVVAGPYHPSFGALVRGRILRNQAETLFSKVQSQPLDTVGVRVGAQDLSSFLGPQRSNLTWLEKRFQLPPIHVDVVQDPGRGIQIWMPHITGPAERR